MSETAQPPTRASALSALSWRSLQQGDWPLRILSAVVALALPTLLIVLTGQDPLAVLREFVTGITPSRFGDATMFASVLILCTASAMLTFNASLWNIGIEGQLAMGTIGATAALLTLRDAPTPVLLTMMMVAGAVAGAAWAFLVALFKLRGVHEIFSGFALNQVAGALVKFMLLNVWYEASQRRMSGIPFPNNAAFPALGPINLWVIGIALVVLFGVVFALARTSIGLRIRAVGLSRVAASYYGISATRVFFLTLLASGAIAGLGGVITASTYFHRFAPDITLNFGFTAILIYLIARMNALGVILLTLLFGLINAGAVGLQIRLRIDPTLAGVIQSSIILALYVLRRREGR